MRKTRTDYMDRCIVRGTLGFAVWRCCSNFCAVFRWIKSHIAVLRWSQTLRCAMFVLLSLRCSVKLFAVLRHQQYQYSLHAEHALWTVYMTLWCVCRVVHNSRQPTELTGYLVRLCRQLLWFLWFFKLFCSFTGAVWLYGSFRIAAQQYRNLTVALE